MIISQVSYRTNGPLVCLYDCLFNVFYSIFVCFACLFLFVLLVFCFCFLRLFHVLICD